MDELDLTAAESKASHARFVFIVDVINEISEEDQHNL